MTAQKIANQIRQGAGYEPADLVLRGGAWFDLVTGQLHHSDIAICGSIIVGTNEVYDAKTVLDIGGLVVVPGFIDTHLHVESSCVTPYEFDRCVTPRGITTAICDPHEIANVAGADGIGYFLDAAQQLVMDLRVQLPSCVPSTAMETSGARLEIDDLRPFMDHPKVIGLAEFMNFPGILATAPDVLAKLEAFEGRHIDGHAPLVVGRDINGYLAAGIRTDHETTSADEALEKLSKGMHILIREGSVSKDLEALIPIITERHSPFLALCTDDRNPLDIAEQGHLDHMIRTAIAKGVDPLAIYRAASISGARAFGLNDRGLIAPGYRADLAIIDSLENCRAKMVLAGGRLVDEEAFAGRGYVPPIARHSVQMSTVHKDDLVAKAQHSSTPIIGINEGKIITSHIVEDLPVINGIKTADPERDIAKIAVIERHGINGNIGIGFVRGFTMQEGAIASTVCHDHHNIVTVGTHDDDMAMAANHLQSIEGGFVVVKSGQVLAQAPLPVGGLMSLKPFEDVHAELMALRDAARTLGIGLEEPFLQLAFLALPVIPHLKITDHGMVDVDAFSVIG